MKPTSQFVLCDKSNMFTSVYRTEDELSPILCLCVSVAGGRSRLHLIDLGSASKSRDPNNVSLSLSALGNVIMALLNGQRHVPHRSVRLSVCTSVFLEHVDRVQSTN